MKIFKKKQFLIGFVLLFMIGILGLLPVFASQNKTVFASADEIAVSGEWTANADGTYTGSWSKYGSKTETKTQTVTVTGKGELSFKYKNEVGGLKVSYNNVTILTSTSATSDWVTGTVGLVYEGSNTVKFECHRTSLTGSCTIQLGHFSIDRSKVAPFDGTGTAADPFLISSEEELQSMTYSLGASYRLKNDITITKNFTPIGTSDKPFMGTLDGYNFTIYNLTVTGGANRALFGYTKGGSISNLNIEEATISGGNYCSFLISYAQNNTNISNVNVDGTISSTGSYIGGIVGFAVNSDGVTATNCTVSGSIVTTGSTIGGLSGSGGTYTDCTVYASISGVKIIGGLTGGYNPNVSDMEQFFGVTNSSFTNCYVAGEVIITGEHNNNYPYWSLINGYGSWAVFNLSNSGQKVTVNYTSSVGVQEIMIFGSNSNPEGISITPQSTENGFTFTKQLPLTSTYVGSMLNANDMLSETKVNGITGNYGGFTIRFKMANGTYKYLSTLNRAMAKFESVFDLSLDNLTSYVDNFSNIEINTNKGTGAYTVESGISIWGSAKIDNANDFEHLSWHVNGAIPTTFKNNLYYNARSITTVGVDFQTDIDLTELRYATYNGTTVTVITAEEYQEDTNAFVLNTNNNLPSGNVLYQFYGFGKSEMYPYRGSFYGNYHNLNVNMDFPESYLMGIIACASDQKNTVVIENLTINGVINGRYRVGIVGMNDNYERESALSFNNVTNNADITAVSQVGGFVGQAQGGASVNLTNCTNNGVITATGGNAGGFVGSLTQHSSLAEVTMSGCTNNGDVTATNIAAGLVATSGNAHMVGENANGGVITSSSGKEYQYIGNFAKNTAYDKAEGSTLKTLYDLETGAPNTELTINGKTYTTDENGLVRVEFENKETLNDVSLEVISPYLKDPIIINGDSGQMESTIVVPKSIVFADSNVYEITDGTWNIQAVVNFSDGTTETIYLNTNLTNEELNSNKLVFVNTSFSNDSYTIPSTLVATLKRITPAVKQYLLSAKTLLTTTNTTTENWIALGTDVKTKYENLIEVINAYGTENIEHFEYYISNNSENINASKQVIDGYFDNIVTSADISQLNNIEVTYGTFEVKKNLSFTVLSGKIVSKEIVYTFEKNNSLTVSAKTNGVSFGVGNVKTYEYKENIDITINKLQLEIEFTNAEYIYDGNSKTLTPKTNVLTGDDVTFKLLYNNQNSAVDVAEYEVVVDSIEGTDATYYSIPEIYTKGQLKIIALKISLNVEDNKSFTYNKTKQATLFSFNKLNESSYTIQNTDFTVVYTSKNYSSTDKPVNQGAYTATITFGNNFEFVGANTFSFTITKKQLTDVEFKNEFTYNKAEPNLQFTGFTGAYDDTINVTSYTIYNSKGSVDDGINHGTYTVQINSVSNDNYYVDNLIKPFVVNQQPITITVGNLKSTYGEPLILNEFNYQITGTVYDGDDLNITVKNLEDVLPNTYPIDINYNNDNYFITVVCGEYTIEKRDMQIVFIANNFSYNSQNQIDSLKPSISNVLGADKDYFVFKLYKKNAEINEVSEFKNSGDYVLKLVENEITNRYNINVKQNDYNIAKFKIQIKVKPLEKNFNKQILATDFGIETITLAGQDKLEDVVDIKYEVYNGDEIVDYTTDLSVGTYVIKAILTAKDLYDNYDISNIENYLYIAERETYITAQDIEKFYDGESVVFEAKLFGIDNEEITDANITYTYYKNGILTDKVKDVGNYTVTVKASAGENNKECEKTYNIVIKTNIVSIAINNPQQTYNASVYVLDYNYTMSKQVNLTNILTYQLLDKDKHIINEIKNADNYYVQFSLSNDNYSLSKDLFEIKIDAINITIQVDNSEIEYKDTFNLTTTTYKIISGALLEGESLDLEFSINNFNGIVNTYTLTAENKNTNYNVTVIDGSFIVKRRVLTLDFSGEDHIEFNEQGYSNLLSVKVSNDLTDNAYSVYYVNGKNQQTTQILDVDNYKLIIEILDTHNYKFADTTETVIEKPIVIYKKEMSLTIDITSRIYNAQNIVLNGVYCGENLVPINLYNVIYYSDNNPVSTPKTVGDYLIEITETSGNYKFVNNTKTFSITAKDITVKSIETSYNYNRNEIKPVLTLNDVCEGDDVKLVTTYNSKNGGFIGVDEYTILINGLTGNQSANYNLIAEDSIIYNIIPTIIEVNITNSVFGFTNKQLALNDLGLIFKGDLKVSASEYSVSELPTNANKHTITIQSLNSGIQFDKTSFEVEITKADITEVELESKTFAYDNKPHSLEVNTVTLSNGIVLNVEYSQNSFTDVGSYEVSATLTNENYNTKILTATLTIEQIDIVLQISTESVFTYNQAGQGREVVGINNLWYKDLINIKYVGENYNSTQKPVNAGNYNLVVRPNNESNINIETQEFSFVINKKAIILQNIRPQSANYCAENIEYTFSYTGVLTNDEVYVNILYDGSTELPYNAKLYQITFDGLSGSGSHNYHLQNSTQTTLTINPIIVNVVADSKTSVYGEPEKELTYVADDLLKNDTYSGNIVRETGTNVNSYVINKGTLTAGDNYVINFTNGVYVINQRQLDFDSFETEFVYNGQSQIPNVKFNNILTIDKNVVKLETVGDTINAGSYTLKFVLINTNYKLPEQHEFTIVIDKKDASDKILGLVSYGKNYDGVEVEPFVLIDGDLEYILTYLFNNQTVQQIKDSGVYTIKVELNNQNFKGEKIFEYTINKIDYSVDLLNDVEVVISSSKFVVLGLENYNISLSINNQDFVSGNVIENLTQNTTYELFVKFIESANYNQTVYSLGEFITSKSALEINEKIAVILADIIDAQDIINIKQILIDIEGLSNTEKQLIDEVNLNILKTEYQNYLNLLNQEIIETKSVSDIVEFNVAKIVAIWSYYISILGAGMICLKGGRNEKKKKQ